MIIVDVYVRFPHLATKTYGYSATSWFEASTHPLALCFRKFRYNDYKVLSVSANFIPVGVCLVLSMRHCFMSIATKRAYLAQCFKFDDEFDDVLALIQK
jgi:hypothetical protein